MKPPVLSIGKFPPATMRALEGRFELMHVPTQVEAKQVPDAFKARVRGLATEVNRGASRELIAMLPKLEVISCFGTGVDLIDFAAANERKIPVSNTPSVMAEECADLAIGMMLASARQIVFADAYVRSGDWARKGPIPLGRSVGGKTMGVLGLGSIGRAIADRGAAFKMRVLYSGPRRKPDAPYDYIAEPVELARQSDVFMVACTGGDETRHLVSAAVIDAVGPEGTLINIARGSVVDEPAMIKALQERRLGFAALDVFQTGPNPPPELLALPNVLLQPHHGSATIETRSAVGQLMIDNLVAFFAGEGLKTPVVR
jgi:lactate dehydrogenase-like 2-hydroxyacid dehydrogenase